MESVEKGVRDAIFREDDTIWYGLVDVVTVR